MIRFNKLEPPKMWTPISLSPFRVGDELDLPPFNGTTTEVLYPVQMPFEKHGIYHENRLSIRYEEKLFGPFSGLASFAADRNSFFIDCSSIFLGHCRVLIGYSRLLFWSGKREDFVEVVLSRFDDGSFYSNQVWVSERVALVATENALMFFDDAGTILDQRSKLPTERIEQITGSEIVKIDPEGRRIIDPLHFHTS